MGVQQLLDAGRIGRVSGGAAVTPPSLHIDLNGADLFKCDEVFGYAGLAGADGCDDVPSGRRTICRQKPQNFVP
ncbi:hypothetical protein AYX19_16060 [Paenarthrobacter ureafaciens]|nr:hypothetical protein AYX19_16060 [Paenarthrobacter ureafaciens]